MLATDDYGRTWTAAETPVVKGALAGIFTMAVADGRPIMVLGGDLDRREEVVGGNAAVTGDGGRSWELVSPAPINGAVYGSAAGGPARTGSWWRWRRRGRCTRRTWGGVGGSCLVM